MQFSSALFALVAIATVSVAALPQFESSSQGSCSTGTAQCCSSVHDGEDAQSIKSLLGLDDVVGQIGLSCVSLNRLFLKTKILQTGASPLTWFELTSFPPPPCMMFSQNQIPVNVVGASAAVSNSCKNTAVCCTGNEANGLIQTSCTWVSLLASDRIVSSKERFPPTYPLCWLHPLFSFFFLSLQPSFRQLRIWQSSILVSSSLLYLYTLQTTSRQF